MSAHHKISDRARRQAVRGSARGPVRRQLWPASTAWAARVWPRPARRSLRRLGLPVVDHGFVDSFALDIDGKTERYVQLLRELPTVLSEWAVHPPMG
jgi:hypothetical protein